MNAFESADFQELKKAVASLDDKMSDILDLLRERAAAEADEDCHDDEDADDEEDSVLGALKAIDVLEGVVNGNDDVGAEEAVTVLCDVVKILWMRDAFVGLRDDIVIDPCEGTVSLSTVDHLFLASNDGSDA